MNRSLNILLLSFVALFCSCEGDILPPQQSQMVVEGWIEDGRHPVVMLTSTVPVSEQETSIDSLGQYLIRWARVALSDGERTVVLSGKYTKDYFPPYIYTTAALLGEAGKTYTLTVDYDRQHATASTTIPQSVPLERLYATLKHEVDSTYSIHAVFSHDASRQRYFRLFTCIPSQSKQFYSAFMGLFDCTMLDNPADVLVNSGLSIDNIGDYRSSFRKGDTVLVKLCTMDEASYRFWYDWDDSENFASNPFMPATSNLVSNVKGALGYWCGYGSSVRMIRVE